MTDTPKITPSDTDPMIGRRIDDRYLIQSLLGRGGSAAVYRARDEKIGRDVAVKMPKSSGAFAENARADFEREASRYILLQHPNTLRLFDYGHTVDGHTYIVTEILTGETLKERLERFESEGRKGIGARKTLVLLKEVAGALSEAHAEGLVHRDLKPSNIFLQTLGGQEVVKVIDFGIAKDVQEATLTGSSALWGTPLYMSPEQSRGQTVDARSDLYSLGVIAFECLTGRPPFHGSTPYAILMQHIDSAPPTLAEAGFTRELPQGYEGLINRLLEKEPEDRTVSSDALIAEVQLVEEIWSSLRQTASGNTVTAMTPDTSKSRYLEFAVAVVLMGILIAQFVMPDESDSGENTAGVVKESTQLPTTPDQVRTTDDSSGSVDATVNHAAKQEPAPEPVPRKIVQTVLELKSSGGPVNVALDGRQLGQTPISTNVPFAETSRQLTFTRRGYKTKYIELGAKLPRFERTVTLTPNRRPKNKAPFELKEQ